MQNRDLNKQIQMKVRKYMEYLYEEELNNSESAEKDFAKIPQSLKNEVCINIFIKLFTNILK